MSDPKVGCLPLFFLGLIIIGFIAMALLINADMFFDPNQRLF